MRHEDFSVRTNVKDGSFNLMKISLKVPDPNCVQDRHLASVKFVWVYTRLNCNSDGSLSDFHVQDPELFKCKILSPSLPLDPTVNSKSSHQYKSDSLMAVLVLETAAQTQEQKCALTCVNTSCVDKASGMAPLLTDQNRRAT